MMTADWQWDEMQQVGTDYNSVEEVAAYDRRMGEFRDVNRENADMLGMLALAPGASVLEIGCGTGRFARAAAVAGMRMTAVDVSATMLAYVRQRAQEGGLPEIAAQHAGFLTMDLPAGSFDAAVSGAALHHLPDAWKLVALRNIARALKPNGQFILRDVAFTPHENESPEQCFERFVVSLPNMRQEAARHVAREFSTYDWIMEGLLVRAGFVILSRDGVGENFVMYHCRKA